MRWQAGAGLLLGMALIGAGACTKDFSRFQFRDLPPVAKSEVGGSSGNATSAGKGANLGRSQTGGAPSKASAGASGSHTGGRGGNPRTDGGAGSAPAHAGTTATLAGSGAGRGAVPSDEDAGMRPDAQMPPDASQPPPDAGPSVEQQCSISASRELVNIATGCSTCACDACAASVLPCLEQGESAYDQTCRALLKCAVSHGCHDWDCYCGDQDCRTDLEAAGNGPCADEMNAAAGGTTDRAAVNAAHTDKDASNPMTMALKATTCILGSEHGLVTGACERACAIR